MSSQQEDRHPNRKSQTQQKVLTQKEDSLRKCLPKKADTQTGNHKPTERFAQKEDSLRNFLPNKQNGTQTANQKPNRNTCPRKETYYENAFPTRRPTPKQQTEIRKRRFAPERRLVKNMSSQQEDRHPNRKSQTQQEVLTQKEDSLIGAQVPPPLKKINENMFSQQEDRHPNRKPQSQQKVLTQTEDSLRKCRPNRKTDTQTGNHEPHRKTRPRKKTH